MDPENVMIIGGGPAGIAAAIQLKRSGLNPIIFEKNKIGGLLSNANLIENYPGFPNGITGPQLVSLFNRQVTSFQIDCHIQEVMKVDFSRGRFLTKTSDRVWKSRCVIIASGTHPKEIKNIKFSGEVKDRILNEVMTLRHIRNKHIVIIGGGDAAFDYALNLARKNRVTILNRNKNHACLPLLYQRAVRIKSISYHPNSNVQRVSEAGDNQFRIECLIFGRTIDIVSDLVILAIGREPEDRFIGETVRHNMKMLRKEGLLHFVGDVNGRIYRQTSIAIGEGMEAAMKIDRKIRGLSI